MPQVKLGRRPVRHDPRTMRMMAYLPVTPPPAPLAVDWTTGVSHWTMMLNDDLGDCTIAGAAHQIQAWTAARGQETIISDAEVLAVYKALSGYDGSDSTDNGCVELDVMKSWRNAGIAGHQIDAFVAIDHTNFEHLKLGVYLFGGIQVGLNLPKSAQEQDTWTVPAGGPTGDAAPGTWDGHVVPVLGYGANGLLVITWGRPKWMGWDFVSAYMDEAYAPLSREWFKGDAAPNGFDFVTLQKDLSALA